MAAPSSKRWEPLVTSGMARGGLWFVVVLSLLFWGLYIWTLTQGVESYVPFTALLSSIALIPAYRHYKRVKAKEVADSAQDK